MEKALLENQHLARIKRFTPPTERGVFAAALAVLLVVFLAGCSAQRINVPELRKANAEAEMAIIKALPTSLGGPVTLQDAIHYALANNLETKIREIEQSIQEEFLTGKKMELLPVLMARASLTAQSPRPAISAEDMDTGATTLPPSYMTDQFTDRSKVYLAWDLLDFGVTYFRSRQALSRLTMMEEQTRRAKQRMVRDVTEAYGRVLATQKALEGARALLEEHNRRLTRSREVDQADISAVNHGLVLEIDSLESIMELSEYERKHSAAQSELAQLMGLAPGAKVEVVDMNTSVLPPMLDIRIGEWEREAIHNRPELSEKDALEKISDDEANIAFAQMFPNPGLILGVQREGNSFLSVNDWFTMGLTVSWNLLSIPRRMSEKRQAELEGEMIKLKRVSLAAAIMAQVNMAALEYQDSIKRYLLKEDIAARRELLTQGLGREKNLDPDRILEEKTEALRARIESLEAYMEILQARETVFASLGRDPMLDRGYAAIQEPSLLPGLGGTPMPQSPTSTEQDVEAELDGIESDILETGPSASSKAPLGAMESLSEPPVAAAVSAASVPAAAGSAAISPESSPAKNASSPVREITSSETTAPATVADTPSAPAPAPVTSAPGLRHPSPHPMTGLAGGDAIPDSPAAQPLTSAPGRDRQAMPTAHAQAAARKQTLAEASAIQAKPGPAPAPERIAKPLAREETRIFHSSAAEKPARILVESPGQVEAEGFVLLTDPDRLVVNISGSAPYRGPRDLPTGAGLVRGLRIQSRSGGMRLVIELDQGAMVSPTFERTEKGLEVILNRAAPTASREPAALAN